MKRFERGAVRSVIDVDTEGTSTVGFTVALLVVETFVGARIVASSLGLLSTTSLGAAARFREPDLGVDEIEEVSRLEARRPLVARLAALG